ncbi:MAG: oxygen-independent coproporphyrinogen III oxidase [Cyanobacteria bacterium NC_groundwater_1444_Ag_S-0.65um_54_12]|nr:oxygen-independent coproporphyrinogen III oxidase [Cyanobacteria bacterium NC_groundwater_1444_Ag_S-0.65um_54_12]
MVNEFQLPRELLARYDQVGPRYTSYPTAPEWSNEFGHQAAYRALADNARQRAGVPLSIYVHLPFCSRLCYYCGCNIKLARPGDALVERYLEALEREVALVAAGIDTTRPVVQLHWGGGTPTHLSVRQLERLYKVLRQHFNFAPGAEISLEIHPRVTTAEQINTLASLGFQRISMGVQDFDPVVQKAVNRLQPFEATRDLIALCQRAGFLSCNLDLMYGLPGQSVKGFARTLQQVATIRPDRIALFNYAHLPAIFPHQRRLKELPGAELKLELFEMAIAAWVNQGYCYLGMDHFALPDNELVKARRARTLRRNFMGYTTCAASDLLAFGMSAISDLASAYYQNERNLSAYLAAVFAGQLPVQRGKLLTADDRLRRAVIYALICHGYLAKAEIEHEFQLSFDTTFAPELAELEPLVADGLLECWPAYLEVTPRGQLLIRNICMIFDAYLRGRSPSDRPFSRTI